MSARHVIFDLDGTLVDSASGIRAALADAANACDPPLSPPPEDIRHAIGPPIDEMAKLIWPSISSSQLRRMTPVFRQSYDSVHCETAPPYPGVCAGLVDLLETGNRIYLATNKPWGPTTRILRKHFPTIPFAAILCIDSIPDQRFANKAEMLTLLLTGFRIGDNAVYVGDTLSDRRAARQVGLPFVSVGYGFGLLTPDAYDAGHATEPASLNNVIRGSSKPDCG